LRALRWPALLVVVILGLAVLYRFGPSRDETRWEWLSVGSVWDYPLLFTTEPEE
jgi:membrane protein